MSSPADSEAQRAAKRKSHRKSRNGCHQCKHRHQKCNEIHPRCVNCVRLDIECTWPSRERFSTSYPTPPESHGSLIVEPHLPDLDIPQDSCGLDMCMADMRLLHHWTTKTCQDMSTDLKKRDAWQLGHVEVALNHPFLLRGILAVAAVHKVLVDPTADRSCLLAQADVHISKALVTYRNNLQQPRAETAIPMFLLSAVLVVYNLATAQLETPEDPINAMTQCFRLIQGVSVVSRPNWEQVTRSQVFSDLNTPRVPIPGSAEPVEEILRLKKVTETKKTRDGEIYLEAIEELHKASVRLRDSSPDEDRLAVAFTWTGHMSERFTNLLAAHDPIAVLVLAHFAVLMSQCHRNWWVSEFPGRIVLAAQKLLMTTPELLDYLDWPLEMINANT